jgi:hypothetical protein
MLPLDCLRALCVATVFYGLLGCSQDDPGRANPPAESGGESKHPPNGLLDLVGNPFDLWQSEPAPATVVIFTRTDCPIANRCAPEIRRLYETHHPRGVNFYLIYVDPRESPETIRRHLREYGYPCQGLRDPKHALVAHCNATTTPEAVVFNKERSIAYLGRVNDQYVGLGKPRAEPVTHDLADAIESTILGRPVTTPRTKAFGCLIADLKD